MVAKPWQHWTVNNSVPVFFIADDKQAIVDFVTVVTNAIR